MFRTESAILKRLIPTLCLLLCLSSAGFAQNGNGADTALTMDQCIIYALKHEPMINMSILNIAITRANNAIATSGWLPQVGVTGTFTHYNSLPTGFFTDSGKLENEKTGIVNTFTPT